MPEPQDACLEAAGPSAVEGERAGLAHDLEVERCVLGRAAADHLKRQRAARGQPPVQ